MSEKMDLQAELGQEKTLKMVLLGSVTFGIYYVMWLMERYKGFNRLAGREIVSRNFILGIVVLMGISIIVDLVGTEAGSEFVVGLSALIDLAYGVMCIIIAFRVSKAMEMYFAEHYRADIKFNAVYLVLFNLFYINYTINDWDQMVQKKRVIHGDEAP